MSAVIAAAFCLRPESTVRSSSERMTRKTTTDATATTTATTTGRDERETEAQGHGSRST